jgi:hypothetical protein
MPVTYPLGAVKVLAIVLIAGGVLGLAYRGFTYTRDSSTTTLGPLSLTVKDERRVAVPVWAGVAAIAAGAGLLLVPVKRS